MVIHCLRLERQPARGHVEIEIETGQFGHQDARRPDLRAGRRRRDQSRSAPM